MSEQHDQPDWTLGLQFLSGGNYIAVNRTVIRAIGLHEAVIIGELASEAMQWAKDGKLEDGWFYSKCEKLEYKTGLSAHLQRDALKVLEELGVIEVKYKGMPRKRFVRISFVALLNVVNGQSSTSLTTSGQPRLPLVVNGVDDINNQEEVINQEEPIYGAQRAQRKKRPFVPPTVDEVMEYVKEKGYHFDPQSFVDYYEADNWCLSGGRKVKSWKRCCATWESMWKDKHPNYKERAERDYSAYDAAFYGS